MRKPVSKSPGRPALDDEQAEVLRRELMSFLSRKAGEPALVEDLTQEALAKVLAGIEGFRGDAALKTWARRIAENVWRDYLRRRQAKPADSGAAQSDLSVLEALDTPDPEESHDLRVTRECLLDAVKQLPLGERSVVLLHEFGDVPLPQVADALGCTIDAAKQRLHRGRRRLADICRSDCASDTTDDGAALCSPRQSGGEDAPEGEK